MVADRLGDESRGDRRAVIVQDRNEPHGIDTILIDDQRAQLSVAILLHYVDEVVIGDKTRHAGVEREGADASSMPIASSIAGDVEPK